MQVSVTILEFIELKNDDNIVVANSYKYSIKKSIGIPADICWCNIKVADEILKVGQTFKLDTDYFELIESMTAKGHSIKILKSK